MAEAAKGGHMVAETEEGDMVLLCRQCASSMKPGYRLTFGCSGCDDPECGLAYATASFSTREPASGDLRTLDSRGECCPACGEAMSAA